MLHAVSSISNKSLSDFLRAFFVDFFLIIYLFLKIFFVAVFLHAWFYTRFYKRIYTRFLHARVHKNATTEKKIFYLFISKFERIFLSRFLMER